MISAQNTKFFSITPPQIIVDDASWTTAEIDTAGIDYLTVFCYFGAMDIAAVALKIQESDTSGSGFADVAGLVYGTSLDIAGAASALPSATADNKCFSFEIDLRGRMRFIDLVATGGNGAAGAYLAAFAIGSRREENTQSVAARGFGNILRA